MPEDLLFSPRPLAPLGNHRPRGRPSAAVLRRRRIVVAVGVIASALLLIVAVVQLTSPLPLPVVRTSLSSQMTAPGVAPSLPWPVNGQAAVAVPSAGLLLQSAPEQPVPVASLTKIMTAYVILVDHPLPTSSTGPSVTMTAQDVADLAADERANETSIPVRAGEVLNERQLLDGLMVHSASDFADALARWDSGSVPAFVVRMNALVASLGLSDTHFADASGYDPSSTSTAADLLRLATAAMRIPTFAAVVAQPAVVLPEGGLLVNYLPLVGVDNVVGVKSGFTPQAGGCVVLATRVQIAGQSQVALAAVTGQNGFDVLAVASRLALTLSNDAVSGVESVPVISEGNKVGTATTPWSGSDGALPLLTASSVSVLAWPGERIETTVSVRGVRLGEQSGAVAAVASVDVVPGPQVGGLVFNDGVEHKTSNLLTQGVITPPSLFWRLLHS